MKLNISYTNKKMQKLAKANGFTFNFSQKIWEGKELSENHILRKFQVVENSKTEITKPESKMSYHEAFDKHGFDFAEEGNY